MATTIRFKRRTSKTDSSDVKLHEGEPFYNTQSHRLYIGNKDDEEISNTKKHITQITALNTSNDNLIEFQIGEDENNVFKQEVNNVRHATSAAGLDSGKLSITVSGNEITVKSGDATATAELQNIKVNGTIEQANAVVWQDL